MSESFQRFLLRHRLAVGSAVVALLLVVLALSTFWWRESGELPAEEAAADEGPAVMEPADRPESAPMERPRGERPAPAEERPRRARSTTTEEMTMGPPPSGESLDELLGPLAGVASPEESMVVLGLPTLRLDDGELDWTIPVIEDGLSHVALGLHLEVLGGEGVWWTTKGVGPNRGHGPYRVHGRSALPESLARRLREKKGGVRVQVAAFRLDERGHRIRLASDLTVVPLQK